MRRLGINLLFCCLLFGCAANGPSLGRISNVQISGSGVDSPADQNLCVNFSLTPEQATEFINRSIIVDHRSIHDHYDFAPCYVRGTGLLKAGIARWEIRAGGTGEITFGVSEAEVIIADPREWSDLK